MLKFMEKYAGATLVSLLLFLASKAMVNGKMLEATIYMVSTFFALALAYAHH